jgi:ComF family protein
MAVARLAADIGVGVVASLLRSIGETAFPARCIGCQRRGAALCLTCRGELPYLPHGVCARCAAYRSARGGCRGCRLLSPALRRVRAPFAYAGAARTAVLTLKFRSGRYLAPLMGEFLRETLRLHALQVDLVVPVPLSPARLRLRGFNQAALLAEFVAPDADAALGVDVLTRVERRSQRTLRAAARLTNVERAFKCEMRAVVSGRRVLLVDDVVTTGATVSACADTLADAGASRVYALAFARDL